VPAVRVVPADVSEHGGANLFAGVEFEVSEFLNVEGREEAFGWRVVPAVALAAHAADDASGLQRLAVVAAGILAAAVGVAAELEEDAGGFGAGRREREQQQVASRVAPVRTPSPPAREMARWMRSGS
jgi:hypothetical protein